MKNIVVGKRKGVTTSVIPHTNGAYPIWFKYSKMVVFIKADKVVFA